MNKATQDMVDKLDYLQARAQNLIKEAEKNNYNEHTLFSPKNAVVVRAAQLLDDIVEEQTLTN